MNKRETIDAAKALLNEGKAQEAASLYNETQEKFSDELNGWDVSFMVTCQRGGGDINNLKVLVEKHKEFKSVRNLYSWLLYDLHVKNFDTADLQNHEVGIEELLTYADQKDSNAEDADDYPCPYTMAVLKIIKHYKKPNFNIFKIAHWIEKLDPTKLSHKENVFVDPTGKERRIASPFEDYYATLSKLKFKEEKYQECVETCDFALGAIDEFHYDNDIWFKRRKALSLIKLGVEDEGFELLLSLSENRKGDKWFLYHEIAKVLFEHEDYEQALKYCIKGIQAFGDEAFKINLLILTARCLFKLERTDDASILANYMVGIGMQYDLNEKADLTKVIDYFAIDKSQIEVPKKHLAEYRKKVEVLFEIDRGNTHKKKNFVRKPSLEVMPGEEVKGWISAVHGNGKSGHVKVGDEAYFFSMHDVQAEKEKLERGVNVMLTFKDATDKEGNPSKHGIILKIVEK
jgi:tetratricopeptide (TPR) repeat protein